MRWLIAIALISVLFAGCVDESSPTTTPGQNVPTQPGDPVASSSLRAGPASYAFGETTFGSAPAAFEMITLTPLEPTHTRTFSYNGPATDFDGPAPVAIYIPTSELIELNLNPVTVEADIMVDDIKLGTLQGTDTLDAAIALDLAGSNGTITVTVRITSDLAWQGDIDWHLAMLAVPRIADLSIDYQHNGFCNTFFIFFCDVIQTYQVALPEAPMVIPKQSGILEITITNGTPTIYHIQECIAGFSMTEGYANCYEDALHWSNGTFNAPSITETVIFGMNFPSVYHIFELQTGTSPIEVNSPSIIGENPESKVMKLNGETIHCNCQPPPGAEWSITTEEGTLNLTSFDGVTLKVKGAQVIGAGEPIQDGDMLVYGNGNAVITITSSPQFTVAIGQAKTPTSSETNETVAYRLLH